MTFPLEFYDEGHIRNNHFTLQNLCAVIGESMVLSIPLALLLFKIEVERIGYVHSCSWHRCKENCTRQVLDFYKNLQCGYTSHHFLGRQLCHVIVLFFEYLVGIWLGKNVFEKI